MFFTPNAVFRSAICGPKSYATRAPQSMKPGMRPVLPSALSFTVLALSANWLDWKSLFRLNVQFHGL